LICLIREQVEAERAGDAEPDVRLVVGVGVVPAMKVDGRGQWRISRSDYLEHYIVRAHQDTKAFIDQRPWRAPRS